MLEPADISLLFEIDAGRTPSKSLVRLSWLVVKGYVIACGEYRPDRQFALSLRGDRVVHAWRTHHVLQNLRKA